MPASQAFQNMNDFLSYRCEKVYEMVVRAQLLYLLSTDDVQLCNQQLTL